MAEKKKKEEKPKHWIERVAEKFGFIRSIEKDKKPYETTSLADGSVQLYLDRKLSERINAIELLHNIMTKPIPNNVTPRVRVKILRDRLDTFNQMIQMIAAPYARGGDNNKYSKLLHGWNKLYGTGLSWIARVDLYFTEDDSVRTDKINAFDTAPMTKVLSDNSIVIHDLEFTLTQHIFPDAFDVLDYCYKDDDVRPMTVTVIQSMLPPQQGFGSGMNINKETENM